MDRAAVLAVTDLLTARENDSIRAFVQQAASEGYLSGSVLDYGAGRMPYMDIVREAGGGYFAYDDPEYPNSMARKQLGKGWASRCPYDSVLCTQVIQYIPDPLAWLTEMHETLVRPGGYLVMTYPTNWPEIQEADLWRFPKAGMERLLVQAGFSIELHQRRATTAVMIDESAVLALGYGVVAKSRRASR